MILFNCSVILGNWEPSEQLHLSKFEITFISFFKFFISLNIFLQLIVLLEDISWMILAKLVLLFLNFSNFWYKLSFVIEIVWPKLRVFLVSIFEEVSIISFFNFCMLSLLIL